MTLKKLSELYYLNIHIRRLSEHISELEGKTLPRSPDWSGRARSTSPGIMFDNILPDVEDERARLAAKKAEFVVRRREIEEYIYSIDDTVLQAVMLFRFVDLLTWREVAAKLGGNNTEDSVKKMCYRYIKHNCG